MDRLEQLKGLIGTPLDDVPEDIYNSINNIDRKNLKVTTDDGFTLVIDRDPLDWGEDEDLDMYLGNIIDVYPTPGYTAKPVEVYEESKPSIVDLLNFIGHQPYEVESIISDKKDKFELETFKPEFTTNTFINVHGGFFDGLNIFIRDTEIASVSYKKNDINIDISIDVMDEVLSNPRQFSEVEIALALATFARAKCFEYFDGVEDHEALYSTTPEMLMNIAGVYKSCRYLDPVAAVGLVINNYTISK